MAHLKDRYDNLYKAQDKVLNLLAKSECLLYLTGGTALQRFHLDNYRYSDDIDLFTVESGVSAKNELVNFINFLRDSDLDFKIDIDHPNFKRLYDNETGLKIDLVYDSLPIIGKLESKNGFLLDNMQDIFINKLDASFSREQARDLFDIYCIIKNSNFDLFDSIEKLKIKSANLPEAICARIKSFVLTKNGENDLNISNKDIFEDFKNNYKKVFNDFFNIEKKLNINDMLFEAKNAEYDNMDSLKAEDSKTQEKQSKVRKQK
ncbi:nucleotidyl transferase AbiEii/AbiGii toxin family protein [Campylobacter sp. faydin G-140]|uniref:nucleotidyl transferase AbiEii/AbiGii toxin family protein n=1 Tax=Campylobacter anatolicus TaxID=2829105 RepID=UPI001B9FB1A5|nr:nucleotidyl transferase AbiEii/AbiGii toxin family protein [Campylobacter anatolicus]MBR8466495.1 nucleotidyl transferase AbiEii/AbiGii toxin family protein [Campylobacter anatolicus]